VWRNVGFVLCSSSHFPISFFFSLYTPDIGKCFTSLGKYDLLWLNVFVVFPLPGIFYCFSLKNEFYSFMNQINVISYENSPSTPKNKWSLLPLPTQRQLTFLIGFTRLCQSCFYFTTTETEAIWSRQDF
jgi:hypothetical protein